MLRDAMRRVQFAGGECYHVYNRGVEQRTTFLTEADYRRFFYDLFVCNDRRPAPNVVRPARDTLEQNLKRVRELLVDILCVCLMPNHFHLLLRQRADGDGVPLFMQKLGTAFTMYFNAKYERSGVLFQGTYKALHVPRDEYLLPLSRYIHLNPLELIEPAWKERGIRDPKRAHAFLVDYPWSSYGDYAGKPRCSSLLDTSLLRSMFRSESDYVGYVERWPVAALRRLTPYTLEP